MFLNQLHKFSGNFFQLNFNMNGKRKPKKKKKKNNSGVGYALLHLYSGWSEKHSFVIVTVKKIRDYVVQTYKTNLNKKY